jgi:hypothetical protein
MSDRPSDSPTLAHLPSLPWVYARLAVRQLRRRSRWPGADAVPHVSACVRGVRVDPRHLARYRRLCCLGEGSSLPIAYPQVLSAGLGASLMLAPGFALPALGVVHLSSAFTERRTIDASERLELSCAVGEARERERGLELELLTRAHAGAELVWDGVTTVLWRRARPRTGPKAAPRSPPDGPSTRWTLAGDTGRRYAAVSGDYNPIHLHRLTALPFGFARPIAHGLYLAARAVGELGASAPPPPRRLEVSFERPVMLPAEAGFVRRECPGGMALALYTSEGNKLYLRGRLVAWRENA